MFFLERSAIKTWSHLESDSVYPDSWNLNYHNGCSIVKPLIWLEKQFKLFYPINELIKLYETFNKNRETFSGNSVILLLTVTEYWNVSRVSVMTVKTV